ncbi:MAG TPA: HGGxSTG domain-containing protein, partial [Acetobacteraceae bacterium]
ESQGPLRNGNPRGDPHASPRCGAKTRAGCSCRQSAMPNGRCRLHGGRSTGPRTETGRAALAAANTKHGCYGAESRVFLAAVDVLLRGAPSPPARGRSPARR